MFIVALNTRMSTTTKKTAFEVVFGQYPNTLERFDIGGEQEVLDEEGLGNLFADTDDDMGEDGEHHGNSAKVIGKSKTTAPVTAGIDHKAPETCVSNTSLKIRHHKSKVTIVPQLTNSKLTFNFPREPIQIKSPTQKDIDETEVLDTEGLGNLFVDDDMGEDGEDHDNFVKVAGMSKCTASLSAETDDKAPENCVVNTTSFEIRRHKSKVTIVPPQVIKSKHPCKLPAETSQNISPTPKTAFKSTFTIKLKPIKVDNVISSEGNLDPKFTKLVDSPLSTDNSVDLPAAKFLSSAGIKRKHSDIDFTMSPPQSITFEDLIKDLSADPSEVISSKVLETALPLTDLLTDSDADSVAEPEKRIVYVSPVRIKRQNVTLNDVEEYTETNIYELLNLPYSEKLFMSSKDASDYLEVYCREAERIQLVLKKYEPSLTKLNNLCVDRLLWLTSETIKRFLKYKFDHLETQRPELSPRRRDIRKNVHENIKINAERMKMRYGKKKRLFVKIFQTGDTVAVKIPKIDRNKVDSKRLPAVIVNVKQCTPPTYKLACKHGTIQGYYSTSDLVSYPGKVDIGNENNEVSLREAAKQQSVQKTDVVFCKCRKNCVSKRCPCKKNNVLCHTRCHRGYSCRNSTFENPTSDRDGSKSIASSNIMLPSYGGKIGNVRFGNTCPIDNWLAMISIVEEEKLEQIINRIHSSNVDFAVFLQYIKDKTVCRSQIKAGTME